MSRLMNILFLLFLNFSFANSLHAKNTAQTCSSAFGTILGTNSNVIGYSNCNNDNESDLWNTVQISKNKTIQTGMKWQCVEYARRWLITQKGYTFDSIDHAYQIWDLAAAKNIRTGTSAPWGKFANSKTKSLPQRGDLLIYDLTQGEHGHVSVIVDVHENHVFIAEQNYSNLPWEGEIYARKLELVKDAAGNYTLQDAGVIGWMRLKA